MGNALRLKDIWPIEDTHSYKLHFARWNGKRQPLDAWVEDESREEWKEWQAYYPGRDDFNRPYIFSVMDFYPESGIWLFGGIFHVKGLITDLEGDNNYYYDIELAKRGESFIGRLKLRLRYTDRATRVYFEKHYDSFEVSEILREPYSGRVFPGHENINIQFSELASLIRNDKTDWKSALENVQGVYMVTDTSTGKRYVGSAYGDKGIWSRWANYAESGHGDNAGLIELIDNDDLNYAMENFRMVLLECCPARMPYEAIMERESFWKEALLTKTQEHGLNKN